MLGARCGSSGGAQCRGETALASVRTASTPRRRRALARHQPRQPCRRRSSGCKRPSYVPASASRAQEDHLAAVRGRLGSAHRNRSLMPTTVTGTPGTPPKVARALRSRGLAAAQPAARRAGVANAAFPEGSLPLPPRPTSTPSTCRRVDRLHDRDDLVRVVPRCPACPSADSRTPTSSSPLLAAGARRRLQPRQSRRRRSVAAACELRRRSRQDDGDDGSDAHDECEPRGAQARRRLRPTTGRPRGQARVLGRAARRRAGSRLVLTARCDQPARARSRRTNSRRARGLSPARLAASVKPGRRDAEGSVHSRRRPLRDELGATPRRRASRQQLYAAVVADGAGRLLSPSRHPTSRPSSTAATASRRLLVLVGHDHAGVRGRVVV